MLKKINDRGACYQITGIPFEENLKKWLKKIPDLDAVNSFLYEEVLSQQKFSVGTLFPQHRWDNTPLIKLWEPIKDKETVGLLLGRLVQKILIEDKDNEWICTHTNLQGRDFETNFYWR